MQSGLHQQAAGSGVAALLLFGDWEIAIEFKTRRALGVRQAARILCQKASI
jgi:hypothetical protein